MRPRGTIRDAPSVIREQRRPNFGREENRPLVDDWLAPTPLGLSSGVSRPRSETLAVLKPRRTSNELRLSR
jgi:hypothetical protein